MFLVWQAGELLGLKTAIINSKPGECTRCGKFSNKRDISGMCKECRYEVSSKVGIHNVEINTIPGICIKCGEYSKIRNLSGMCQKCSSVGKSNFLEESIQPCGHKSKSVLSNGEYVCWKCYIQDFDKSNFIPKFNGIIVPTFLKQNDTNSIPGNKFETYLSDLGIGWFVYIKYHENGKPLVVGKSGSLLVNSNGSDLSFDRKEDGGPARQLLIDTSSNWNRTMVEILKVNSELEALDLEYSLQLKFKIFGS